MCHSQIQVRQKPQNLDIIRFRIKASKSVLPSSTVFMWSLLPASEVHIAEEQRASVLHSRQDLGCL